LHRFCAAAFYQVWTILNTRRVCFGHFQRKGFYNFQVWKFCGTSRLAFSPEKEAAARNTMQQPLYILQ